MKKIFHNIRSLRYFWVWAIALSGVTSAVVFAIVSHPLTGYHLANNTTTDIDYSANAGDQCKKIANNSGSGIFVPTKTDAEWNAFVAHKPSNITISECCTDSCAVAGATQCIAAVKQTCGNYDADPCLEWGNTGVCCTSHDHIDCYNNDVYWYDSCNNREEVKTDCGSGNVCLNETCCGSTWPGYDSDYRWVCETSAFGSCCPNATINRPYYVIKDSCNRDVGGYCSNTGTGFACSEGATYSSSPGGGTACNN